MQFLTTLLGGGDSPVLTAVIALGLVLVLIVLGLWVLKLFFRASNRLVQGRGRRMMVLETIQLDARRQLILVRRDEVEHVILTGGPQDVVVESGIPVDRVSQPRRPGAAASTAMVTPSPAPAPPQTTDMPAPSRPVSEALSAGPAHRNTASAPSPMDRLRDLARPVAPRGQSLRHTGLLRAVSRMEPAAVIPMNPEAADNRRPDSARSLVNEGGQTGLGGGTYPGSGIKAEGN